MRRAFIVYSILVCVITCSSATAKPVGEDSASDAQHKFSGLADYYHHKLYGKKTASGQVLQKDKMTAAHRTLPFGTKVKVTHKRSGRSCIVVINDRGPFTPGKVIDLSYAAASHLGVLEAGTCLVACKVVADEEED